MARRMLKIASSKLKTKRTRMWSSSKHSAMSTMMELNLIKHWLVIIA